MSISSYSELLTAGANWLHRSDLTARFPEFIALAENRIHFGSDDPQFPSDPLRIRAMQSTTTGAVSSGTISYPSDYIETQRLYIVVGGENKILRYKSPTDNAFWETQQGHPNYYTESNGSIKVGPYDGSTWVHDYYAKLAALTASNTTNWLILNSPNVYLYGILLEAAPYLGKEQKMGTWYRSFMAAIGGLQESNKSASQFSGLAVVPG